LGPQGPYDRRPYPDKEPLSQNTGSTPRLFKGYLCRRFGRPTRWGVGRIAEGLGISHDSAQRGLHATELAGLVSAEREPGCNVVLSVNDLPKAKGDPDRLPLYGPIPWLWWASAARLPGKSLQVGAACWLSAGWLKSGEFDLGLSDWSDLGLSRFSAARGLDCLAVAGLVKAVHRPGRSPFVRLLDGRGTVPVVADDETA